MGFADRIYISHNETVALVKAGGALALQFGSNAAWLKRDAEGRVISAWALPMLRVWRGTHFENGGGI